MDAGFAVQTGSAGGQSQAQLMALSALCAFSTCLRRVESLCSDSAGGAWLAAMLWLKLSFSSKFSALRRIYFIRLII
jgi:hypothetical protein